MGKKAEQEKRRRREEYKFSPEIIRKIQVRSGGICEQCGKAKGNQIHHILAIAVAIMNGLDPKRIRSVENGLHVCPSCHQKID